MDAGDNSWSISLSQPRWVHWPEASRSMISLRLLFGFYSNSPEVWTRPAPVMVQLSIFYDKSVEALQRVVDNFSAHILITPPEVCHHRQLCAAIQKQRNYNIPVAERRHWALLTAALAETLPDIRGPFLACKLHPCQSLGSRRCSILLSCVVDCVVLLFSWWFFFSALPTVTLLGNNYCLWLPTQLSCRNNNGRSWKSVEIGIEGERQQLKIVFCIGTNLRNI